MEDERFIINLRDQFAAHAMAAILISPDTEKINPQELARHAYIVADAMLKERTKKY